MGKGNSSVKCFMHIFSMRSNSIHVNVELCILLKGFSLDWRTECRKHFFFPVMHCQVAEVTMNNSVGMQTSLVFNIQIVPVN